MAILLLAALVAGAAASGLVDHSIAGDSVVYLDGADWTAVANNAALPHIAGTVPGDLISDLYRAHLIGEPLFMKNFKNSTLWIDNVWTYSKNFSVGELAVGQSGASRPSAAVSRCLSVPPPLPPPLLLRLRCAGESRKTYG
jgi:hypothetical protein